MSDAATMKTATAQGRVASRYAHLETRRSPFLARAQEASKLTLPALIPAKGQSQLPTPYQGFGARGTKNLGAKTLLALFPPENPFFRLRLSPAALAEAQAEANGKDLQAAIEKQLSVHEAEVQAALDGGGARPSLFLAILHAIVGGNYLLVVRPDNTVQFFPLSQYVVRRDLEGNLLEIVLKQSLARSALPPEVQQLIKIRKSDPADPSDTAQDASDSVDLYTHVRLEANGRLWRESQEVEGVPVPKSGATYPKDKSPWIVGRWTEVPGEDYGRGHVEEYIGDLYALDGLSQAILEGAMGAAKLVWLVDEAGTTRRKTVAEANNLDFVSGTAKDVTVLGADKYADFRVAFEQANALKAELSEAFLLSKSVQRSGERVTAEEIRYLAAELETALGGLYSLLSRDLQRPLVAILLLNLQRQGRLKPLPGNGIQVSIITGLDALGRTNDLRRLSSFGVEGRAVVGDAQFEAHINAETALNRVAVATGVDKDGLVRSTEEVQQMQQAQQAQVLREKLGPQAIKSATDLMAPDSPSAPTPTP